MSAQLKNEAMSSRKPHQELAGYVCELRNQYSGGHTIILDCKSGGLLEDWKEAGRYQVLCDSHSQVEQYSSLPKARAAMKDPTIFCLTCRELAGEGDAKE